MYIVRIFSIQTTKLNWSTEYWITTFLQYIRKFWNTLNVYFNERKNERQQFDTSQKSSHDGRCRTVCLYNLSFHLADDDLINLQIFLTDLFNSTIYRNKKDSDVNESTINREIINDMRRPFQKRSKKKKSLALNCTHLSSTYSCFYWF